MAQTVKNLPAMQVTQVLSLSGEDPLEKEMAIHSAVATGKGQFSFQSQRRAVPKNVQTTTKIAFISHASKVMLKILQARLQHYMN